MFIGYNVKNAIRRCVNTESYNIRYNPIGGCFDHLLSAICSKLNHELSIRSLGNVKMDGAYPALNNDSGYNFNITLGTENANDHLVGGISTILIIEDKIINVNDKVKNAISKYEYILCLDYSTYETIKSYGHPHVFHSMPNLQQIFGNIDLLSITKSIDVLIMHTEENKQTIRPIVDALKQEGLNAIDCSEYGEVPLIELIKSSKMVLHIDDHKFTNYLYANFFGAISLSPHQASCNNQSIFFAPDTASIISIYNQVNPQYDQIIQKINLEKNKSILSGSNFIEDISKIFSQANNTVINYA